MARNLSTVIPGPAEGRNPESITNAAEYGFRVPRFARSRNDKPRGLP
jgi:hypothetical protein